MSGRLRILYKDSHFVAVEKPPGFWVHQAEPYEEFRVPAARNCMRIVRDQIQQYVYPVHRLDRATSGVLLFGLTQEFASLMGKAFMNREVHKTYVALTRGWWPSDFTCLDDGDGRTRFECIGKAEWPEPVGRYSTCRYSLVFAYPESGRRHQIRIHSNRANHPIIGDTSYGDRNHNRHFRESLGWPGLFLKALELAFRHPVTGEEIRIRSRFDSRWHVLFDRFGICPLLGINRHSLARDVNPVDERSWPQEGIKF